ncbi:exopolysaccharide biosynthesis protein YbjH [Aliiruegeria haliotis]|uniref:Exopolysaccharide biosynthesis protein YbjH n=1 Tax=Aliiruegeria haliotis TaxID=1280846 RepID=A0A2T0RPF9_9RHOB|nr:YjbH domain-containing protein [Aliiruegeria haliotis]PRY23017.1 exopolysaccharide biosynthesis protein YbjH [Aliiruegeria haliotis]
MPEQKRKAAGRTVAAAVIVYGAAGPLGGVAEPLVSSSYNLYGVPGLVEMPTAEMAPDAEFSGSFSQSDEQLRVGLTFQFAPRLSGTFRYTKIPDFGDPGENYYDRNFDLRFQILEESQYIPAVAVGFQDIVGTSLFSAEYLVATKTFFDDVRVTAGLGWGRLGSRNPVAEFGSRDFVVREEGGEFNASNWFQGPMAIFGGVSWRATDKLTLKAEYSSDAYEEETRRGLVDYQSPWNLAAEYRFNDGVSLSAASLYGEAFGAQLNFTLNPKRPLLGPGNEPGPLPIIPRPSRSAEPLEWSTDWVTSTSERASVESSISKALADEGIRLEAIQMDANRAEVRVQNNRYYSEAQAIGRTARVLALGLPATVESVTITPVTDGVPANRVTFRRTDLERLENSASKEILSRAVFTEGQTRRPQGMEFVDDAYPRANWFLGTYLGFGLFDPDEPVRADFGLRLGGSLTLAPGFVASGSIKHRLLGNTEEATAKERSDKVPVVRTDFREYSRATDTFIDTMTLAHFGRPAPELHSRLTAGILERMYSGVSGELLWKPFDSNLAIGGEVNYVYKRAYDGGFGLQDYNVLTGHGTVYYEMPKGYNVQVDGGRYLAGDYGGTLRLERRFDNGWKFGAYATMTDVAAEDFGDGSFDKGIYMQLPLRWATGQPSKSVHRMSISPFTSDGGQKVRVDDRLYERIRRIQQPDIEGSGGRFWR